MPVVEMAAARPLTSESVFFSQQSIKQRGVQSGLHQQDQPAAPRSAAQQRTQHSSHRTQAAGPAAAPDAGRAPQRSSPSSIASMATGMPPGGPLGPNEAEQSILFSFPQTGGSQPGARWAHAAAAVGSLLFAYGGVGQVVLDDLAVLDVDLMTWRALKPRAAAPRDRPGKLHAAAMAAAGRTLWMFGGQQGRRFLRELYALDTESITWSLASPACSSIGGSGAAAASGTGGPAARAGHTMTAVEGAGIFMFGGQGKRLFDDLHLLVTPPLPLPSSQQQQQQQQQQEEDLRRQSSEAAATAPSPSGGSSTAPSPSAAAAAAAAAGASHPQHQHPNGALPPHDDAASVGSGASSSAVSSGAVSGGAGGAPPCEWVEIKARGQGPSPRRGHSLTYDGRGSLVCFGGSTSSSTDNGLWLYSIARREWMEIRARGAVPPPRTHHSAVLLRPGQLFIFGGCNASGVFFQDAYLLDLSTFTWSCPLALGAPPAPRYNHSCTRVGRRVVIYGGVNPRQAFDGVALVECGSAALGGELSAVADELCRMSNSAVSESGASSLPAGPWGGGAVGGPGSSVHGSSLYNNTRGPSAPPSLAGSAATAAAALAAAAKRRNGSPPGAAAARGAATADASASDAGGGGGGSTTGVLSGDLMKLQLRDLLVKRHLEDLQIASARKVEELTAALDAARRAKAAAERELSQARLVCAETEERARQLRRRAVDEGSRAAREAAEAEAARTAASEATAARRALEQQLAEANALLDSVSRELGLLSSRHHRLQLEHAALQRSRQRARERERAARADADVAAVDAASPAVDIPRRSSNGSESGDAGADGSAEGQLALASSGSVSAFASLDAEDDTTGSASLPISRSPSGGAAAAAALGEASAAVTAAAAGGDISCPHASADAAACLLCAVSRCLAATQLLLAQGAGAAAAALPAGLQQPPLPSLPSAAGAAGAEERAESPAEDDDTASLKQQLAEARTALAASESARTAADRAAAARASEAETAASDAAELRLTLQRLGGDRLALAACSASELRELEARLDAAGRAVRELVVERTVSEMQRRISGEGQLCGLCLERRKAVVFNCGHQTCSECSDHLKACAFCRVDIATRIRLWQS